MIKTAFWVFRRRFGVLIPLCQGMQHQSVAERQIACEKNRRFLFEGTVATSKLQREVSQLLSIHLGQYTIRENSRPNWLAMKTGERLELDFYIEEPKIAIEVQGQQHYAFTPHFHKTYADFEAQLSRDQVKREICESKGITLHEVVSIDEAFEIATRLCPEIQWPIHPKSVQRTKQVLAKLDGYRRREKIQQMFKKHKHTPRKHLRRLLRILSRYDGTNTLTPKNHRGIKNSLASLRLYQEAKGKVQFNEYEDALLKAAQALIATNTDLNAPFVLEKEDMSKGYYGTQRTRHRAKVILKVEQVFEFAWLVTGGESKHRVTLENRIWHCDCSDHEGATDGMCSHCLAAHWAVYGNFRKRKS